MLVQSNYLLEAFTSHLWFYNLFKVTWTQICTWKTIDTLHISTKYHSQNSVGTHPLTMRGPFTPDMTWTSLGCVIVTIWSPYALSPSLSLVDRFSFFFSLPHATLPVWLWENFWTVRESPPLFQLAFPLGSSSLREGGWAQPYSETLLLLAIPGDSSGSKFLCSVFWIPNHLSEVFVWPVSFLNLNNIGGAFWLFSTEIKQSQKETSYQWIISHRGLFLLPLSILQSVTLCVTTTVISVIITLAKQYIFYN